MTFAAPAKWLTRLKVLLETVIGCVFGFFVGNKVASAAETRQIDVGAEADGKKHNKIKTSRYTLLMFVPQNLAEQFRRVVNFYFLVVTVVAVVIDSPVSPLTSIAPLSFMVMVTAVKNGYEDWLRHKVDDRINNTIVEIVHRGVIKQVRNSTIAPGTLVRVKRGKEVPADLVLLCSEGDGGRCYVTTANLDGETNLKTLRVPPPLVGYTPDVLPRGMRIEVPRPVADLYTFYGRLEIPNMDSLPLTTDNLMLRGSRVKNTEWAIGCAVYTGEETKLALNSKYAGNKFSSCELAVNGFLVVFIAILVLEILLSYAMKRYNDSRFQNREAYLGPETSSATVNSVLQDMFSFLLLYYYIIPTSLFVTIELYKFIGALFIGWDEELRCEETGKPAIANTSDLNEELGQVEILFSDKTGTLTKNVMVFKACSIKGIIYEEREKILYDVNRFEEPVDTRQVDIRFFFKVLALCHSVQISNEDMKRLSARLSMTGELQIMNMFRKRKIRKSAANGNGANGAVDNATWNTMMSVNNVCGIDYQASSPDEKALVEAADRLGVTFLGEEGNNLIIKMGDETEMYERLQVIEFTSDRKRMSVVVRDKDGKIFLFCKGAESAVFPLCRNEGMVEDTNVDINTFATKGLRTLAVAYREIPDEEYERVCESIKKQDVKNAEALQQVSRQFRLLERDLTLVGATAVEDCLQDDVADTLSSLRRAGLRIWVLTGDKVETAINVAQSCAHISEDGRQMYLVGVDNDEAIKSHLEECKRILAEPSYKDLALIVDGTTMSYILDKPVASVFAEISLKCNAVLCCRLSPIQKAKIVKLIKHSPERPITAAIGDGANDISMIHEAHVGFGIFGKEGYQAARSADFAFTKFSMVKKFLLVMGHWYYQRLATLIHYFFYKNLVLGNIMLFFQINSAFSTQSVFDSMYLTFFNLFFTAVPCLILSVTEQRWPKELLLRDPTLYKDISRNKLMSWSRFSVWLLVGLYHAVVIYAFSAMAVCHSVINSDMKALDLWMFGAILFHFLVLITNLKIWMQARYHSMYFVLSVVLSVLVYMIFNVVYSLINTQIDGAILGTYTRLCSSLYFWLLNALVIVATLAPDYCYRFLSDRKGNRLIVGITTIFTTRL